MQRLSFLLITLLIAIPLISAQAVDEYELFMILGEYIEPDEPGMVVYVFDNGTEASAAYGLANLDTGETLSTDDVFRIASTTKPMVATIVLWLVDSGDIELDAPIADYLSSEMISNIPNAESTTVRQMLQMTSGIFDYTESDVFDDAVQDNPSYGWTAAEVLTFAYDEEPYFAAGDGYYYSNTNYILAELVIEAVSGMSLDNALNSIIFEPLSMDSCFLETPSRFTEALVQGYELGDDNEYVNITRQNDGVGMGDGGVICNVADLAKFPIALWNGDLISEALLNEMLTTVDDGEGGQYGLGIGYDDTEFGMILSHDGASSGFQSDMLYLPDDGIVVTILTNNFDSDVIEDVKYDVLDAVFGS